MDVVRPHPQGGVPLTSAAGVPSPAPSPRRFWLFLLVGAIVAARILPTGALSAQDVYTIQIGESSIDVSVRGQIEGLSGAELREFIENSARGVAAYFGRFPVPRARLVMRVGGGRGVNDGRATPGAVPTVSIGLGGQSTRRGLQDDWVLVHEMTHLGFPDVDGPHQWMSEGFATYVEPIARVRNGSLTIERFWSDLIRDLPQGLPGDHDDGLNSTRSWAATYWGGALFWFLTDVRIRQVTGNKKGLEDVMRAMNRDEGDMRQSWTLATFLGAADREIGAPVMSQMYDEWARRRGSADLNVIWKRLGVAPAGYRNVTFDNAASLANVRRAITGRPKA